MKTKGLVLAGLMALALLVIAAIPANAEQATVSIGDVSLAPQASATLPIMITNETAQKVSSGEINLTYDPSVVQVTGVEGNELFDIFTSNIIDGTVSMAGMNSTTGLTTPIRFADVTVKAVGNPGDYTSLNFTAVKLSDEMGGWIEPIRSNGSVSIIAVVPAYNIYGLSALIGLLAIILGISIMAKIKRR